MFTTGLMIFLGVGLILPKLPRRTMLKALKHDLKIDIAVSCTGAGHPLGHLLRGDGGDGGGSHDQPRHLGPEEAGRLHRRGLLRRRQVASERVKDPARRRARHRSRRNRPTDRPPWLATAAIADLGTTQAKHLYRITLLTTRSSYRGGAFPFKEPQHEPTSTNPSPIASSPALEQGTPPWICPWTGSHGLTQQSCHRQTLPGYQRPDARHRSP